ncbi:uncharacterized protein [Rutidosis leptorrhynchoides]|uniref:uncharacterized protein isoform X2 n=1 Tax=Rutidosis leptorrhynchoides TaxID=125765 RepID=UPI003A99D633
MSTCFAYEIETYKIYQVGLPFNESIVVRVNGCPNEFERVQHISRTAMTHVSRTEGFHLAVVDRRLEKLREVVLRNCRTNVAELRNYLAEHLFFLQKWDYSQSIRSNMVKLKLNSVKLVQTHEGEWEHKKQHNICPSRDSTSFPVSILYDYNH